MRKSMRAAPHRRRRHRLCRAQVRTDERWFLCDGQPGEYSGIMAHSLCRVSPHWPHADDLYREGNGLQRTAGLITADLRTRIQHNAKAHMASSTGQAFIDARDPQKAQAARLAQSRPWRTATRATNRAARAGKGRRGTEVTCANPDCGAVFCPLTSAKRRQFCSRNCATKHARRTTRGHT
jgi:hypothetical protein